MKNNKQETPKGFYDESNRIIAEFMGIKLTENGLAWDYINNPIPSYQNSWDCLMPVVSKITRDEQYIDNDYREHLLDVVPYGHIEDVYDAVVGFVMEHTNYTPNE